jgi:quercetin dioxygenase-like cupin family protein
MSLPNAHREGRIREPEPTSGPVLTFNLYTEIRRLESEQPWQAEHTANTIVKYPDLRIILVALKAGGKLVEHRTSGRISIQTLSGLIEVHTPDGVIPMPIGHLVTIDHDLVHDVVATGDSVFLLTIAWPGQPRQADSMRTQERSVTSITSRLGHSSTEQTTTAVRNGINPRRELGLDRTLEETFPCSDPISSDPNPLISAL